MRPQDETGLILLRFPEVLNNSSRINFQFHDSAFVVIIINLGMIRWQLFNYFVLEVLKCMQS